MLFVNREKKTKYLREFVNRFFFFLGGEAFFAPRLRFLIVINKIKKAPEKVLEELLNLDVVSNP